MTRLSNKDSASLRSHEDRLERENEDRLFGEAIMPNTGHCDHCDQETEVSEFDDDLCGVCDKPYHEINLFLIRGLPGSGKDTLAMKHIGPAIIHSADHWFMRQAGLNVWNTEYQFNPAELPQAHEACQKNCAATLTVEGGRSVAVCNTFSCRWEMEPYLKMAKEIKGVSLVVIDLFDAGLTDEELAERNIHDVPVENIAAMRERWEFDWKNGNPLPPWER